MAVFDAATDPATDSAHRLAATDTVDPCESIAADSDKSKQSLWPRPLDT
jgi:hypothetical protein